MLGVAQSLPEPEARTLESAVKVAKVRELAVALGLDAVLLKRADNFAWITAGGSNVVGMTDEVGVAAVLVTGPGVEVLAGNNEVARISDEEVGPLGIPVSGTKWHSPFADFVRDKTRGMKVGSDVPGIGRDVTAEVAEARSHLTSWELARYREVGKDAARAVERCALGLRPGMSETKVAADLETLEKESGLVPSVTLIAADERVARYRHPVPTGKAVARYCMLTTCARRGGLTVALTRLVHFGRPPEELTRRFEAVVRVDATMILNTVPGRAARDVLARAADAYARFGYPGEWELHHQGGAIAYANREYVVTPSCDRVICADQAYAWNPTISGAKSEDTIVISEISEGRPRQEAVTRRSPEWPSMKVHVAEGTIERPGILVVS